ncbi:hypothetical protein Y032_0037g3509 [Ancylostoma ceylanicum]|uniref:Uncharacterized protein n=1 Tax=Ancylostoma ceylanicum TaxID=53326 RepID=A0A016ULL9_9BILA|nr:hypothetical protein Y032_0037g3509 [Ancylostoma ceylanicum]
MTKVTTSCGRAHHGKKRKVTLKSRNAPKLRQTRQNFIAEISDEKFHEIVVYAILEIHVDNYKLPSKS